MDFQHVQNITKAAEKLGFDFVTLMDHFRPFDTFPPKNGKLMECWTTLSALAMKTNRIQLGSMVNCTLYRNPALVAKIASSFDHISNGRLKFGIGACNFQNEFEEYGYYFEKPRIRIERLEEAITIIKMLWMNNEVSYEGKHYKIKNAVCEPKPIQEPHPPIFVGGRGEQFTLKVVARLADGWNFPGRYQQLDHKLKILRNYCTDIGRNMEEITVSWATYVILSSDPKEIALYQPSYFNNMEDFIDFSLIGTPEDCIKKMNRFIELGVTDFEFIFPETFPILNGVARESSIKMIEDFSESVLPEFSK